MSLDVVPGLNPAISRIGFLLIPDFPLMSYASAVEPLRAANRLAGKQLYHWWHATPDNEPAFASNGAGILPDFNLGSMADLPDLLLVCAGGNPTIFHHPPTFSWLRQLGRRGVALGGISGGPYLLAKAGLLDDRKCTIHWEHMPAFKETFPEIELTRSLFEFDRDRLTCSGGIATLDMMVAIIARDHGQALAAAVGDWFLHTHIREGVGPQRMDLRFRLGVADDKILRTLKAMEANLEAPLSRAELASIADVSLRQLERSFRDQLGRGVHEHYLALRLGRARQLLRESSMSILEIAVATGFASASNFTRAFQREFKVSPTRARAQDRRKTIKQR